MWLVELNVAGYRFTHAVPDLRRKVFRSVRLSPRGMRRRIPQLRHSHAA